MEEKPKSEPESYWTQYRPLYQIAYQCLDCATVRIRFQPIPRELNKDHRQFCFVCKKIVNHTQKVPPTT
jgi:hypothetical protein